MNDSADKLSVARSKPSRTFGVILAVLLAITVIVAIIHIHKLQSQNILLKVQLLEAQTAPHHHIIIDRFALPATSAVVAHPVGVIGYIGVSIVDIRRNAMAKKVARSDGYTHLHGLLVEAVSPNSPAARGGVRGADIITTINGKTIRGINQLLDTIRETRPGKKVALGIFRNGTTLNLTLVVSVRPTTRPKFIYGGPK